MSLLTLNKQHPPVLTHRSGRKSLVLGVSTDYVVGVDRDDGRALRAGFLDHAALPEQIFSHRWSGGDPVIWDNRGVRHRAGRDKPPGPSESDYGSDGTSTGLGYLSWGATPRLTSLRQLMRFGASPTQEKCHAVTRKDSNERQ
ncbi:hypothetical protein MMAN_21160 [Mycobacterium mantenii]|uniref:TauD/TfdA-like domain-containing protein n=1 Tax=Mycobacterium mantenii TaxID=560555 RepID=A0ABM7JRP3_MYCNT|nr:TauD/TfdA family dioxygenase [Mycobacterium mantenii]BBY37982.1 hypothetical protein MMAN_21160 [Mycobacterium mantenii]